MYLKTLLFLMPFIIGGTNAGYWIARVDTQVPYSTHDFSSDCETTEPVWMRKSISKYSTLNSAAQNTY